MGKKKRKEGLPMAWCWYCDREFEDEKVLINHQKAKHFKCSFCNKKLNTAGGMLVHLQQVHRENIRIVPNCIPGRESIDIEIFGMEGVPYEDLQRYLQEKEQGTVFKRSKIEQDPEEIRKQFAAFQAKKDDPSLAAQSSTPSNVDIVNQPIPMVSLPPMGFSGMPFIPGMPLMPGMPLGMIPPMPVQLQVSALTDKIVDDSVVMIYDDNQVSMEEKRAKIARYEYPPKS